MVPNNSVIKVFSCTNVSFILTRNNGHKNIMIVFSLGMRKILSVVLWEKMCGELDSVLYVMRKVLRQVT